jgi:hypothetical protein
MDLESKRVFSNYFYFNPVFFLEVARVKAGISNYVLPQQILPDVILPFQFVIEAAAENFVSRKINSTKLYSITRNVEKNILKSAKNSEVGSWCEELELKLIPKIYFLNRILSSPTITPDVNIYVANEVGNELKSIGKIERKVLDGKIDFEEGRKKIIEIEGKMLGYPECCIENFTSSKEEDIPAETKLVYECIENNHFIRIVDSLSKSRMELFPSLFTSNFYPCSFDCKKAMQIGFSIDKWLEDFSPAFRLRTMINGLYLLVSAYKSHTHGSPQQKVDNFFYSLNRDWIDLLNSVEGVISNLTEFTNALILRICRN